MTSDEFVTAVSQAIDALGLAGEVQVAGATVGGDGAHDARLTVRVNPAADAHVRLAPGVEGPRAASEIRGELRRALRLCPVCQRIGHVEKIADSAGVHDACLVVCPSCGRYEIDQALIKDLRAAWERGDADVLGRLPSLSSELRQGTRGRITAGNWKLGNREP